VTPDAAPVAALTVTPTTGVAPFAVTADASASTDTDPTPIASYTFNFGDGTATATQATPTASHTYTKAGTFTLTVTVTDTAKLSATATQQVISKQNLIGNSGFENNTSGWTTDSSTVSLTRVAGGHSGSWAAQLANTGASATSCILDDSPNSVNKTAAGTYTAMLWVKGATAGVTLTLRLQELKASTVVGSAAATVTLSTSWQLITVSYPVTQAGKTALDYNAFVSGVPGRTTGFYADDAALVLG
jgi:PKD repeat protein